MYRDKDRQREANKLAQARFKAKNRDLSNLGQKQGLENAPESNMSVVLGNTLPVIPLKVIPKSNTLTIDQIVKLTLAEAKAILKGWAQGNGNTYQQVLGNLATDYDIIKGV
jgi:hypothetical protein